MVPSSNCGRNCFTVTKCITTSTHTINTTVQSISVIHWLGVTSFCGLSACVASNFVVAIVSCALVCYLVLLFPSVTIYCLFNMPLLFKGLLFYRINSYTYSTLDLDQVFTHFNT